MSSTITAVADLIEVGADENAAIELVAARSGRPVDEVSAHYNDWLCPMDAENFAYLLVDAGVDLDELTAIWEGRK
jgi:hypothetical protein